MRRSPRPSPVLGIGAFLIAAMMIGVAPAAASPLFPNPQFEPDPRVIQIRTADFNHDGRPDVATLTSASILAVYLGLGGGVFAPRIGIPVPGFTPSFSIGDFNGDGTVDLAALSFDASGRVISVFLSRGDGTFGAESRTPIPGPTGALVADDLNGDRLDDVVLTDSSSLTILLSRGDGTFSFYNRAAGASPGAIATGDFNGDHRVDLSVRGSCCNPANAYLLFLFGNGDGTFVDGPTLPATVTSLDVPVAADFNQDGVSDLIAGGELYLGSPSGNITPLGSLNACCFSTPIARDFDGDGRIDLAFGVAMYLGNGDGTFRFLGFPTTAFVGGLTAAADFNADGRLDLAVGGINTVLLGKGDGTFVLPQRSITGVNDQDIVQADFNRDGFIDLATGNGGGSVILIPGTGPGRFGAPRAIPTGSDIRSVAVGDFNQDGFADIAATDYLAPYGVPYATVVLLGLGDGRLSPPTRWTVGTQPTYVVVTDLNGDQRDDLAVADYGSNDVAILLGNGDGSFASPSFQPVGTGPRFIAAGDLNADGLIDLAVTNIGSHDVSILLGRGDGTFQPQMSFAVLATFLAIGDFDADGIEDLVGSSPGVSFLKGEGGGRFAPPLKLAAADEASQVVAADFNSDHLLDLAVAYYSSSTLAVFLNTGAGFSSPQLFAAWPLPVALVPQDFSGDGFPDLLIISDVGVNSNVMALTNLSCVVDSDGDGVCDDVDNCPSVPNPDQNPCACLERCDEAVDLSLSFSSPLGKGSGTLTWTTLHERSVAGFNVVTVSQQGAITRLNAVLIPCEECVTLGGRTYTFYLPKHKSGHNVFVEVVHTDGSRVLFGPALKR